MKKTLLSFVFLLTAIAAGAQSIISASITYTFNGQQSTMNCTETGCPTVDLSGTVAENFKIDGCEVKLNGVANDVRVVAEEYKDGDNKNGEDRYVFLTSMGNGVWKLSLGEDEGWIVENNDRSTGYRNFRFYFVAFNKETGTSTSFDNGGNQYLIRFYTKDGSDSSNGNIISANVGYVFNGQQYTMNCTATGCETVDLSGTVAENLKINGIAVQTSGNITDLKMLAADYKSGEKDPEIADVPLAQEGDVWYLPAETLERMGGGWIVKDNNRSTATRYFSFCFVANKDDKNPIIFDNGGNYYSIRFKTDDGQGGGSGETDNITFYDTNTATLTLLVTGGKDSYSYTTYTYNGDGTRDIQDNPGELSSLYIDNFTLRMQRSSANLEIESVSVQYKVFEEGSDAQWNTMNYSYQEDEGGNILNKKYTGVAATQDLAEGLKPGKTYVLQVKYQIVDNKKNYYFFTPSSWYGEYRFSVKEEGGGGTGIRGDVNGDGIVNGTDIQEIINIIVNGE